ncbi:phage major capsid protein, P2 family [Comamonas kerstersii]|uniref:Phage major capsid protein, P2 family n=1 Tax=Comamonas kerstersii TaxID=225992 RepID=A0A1V0BI86_9BURK|nr:phage major capsid protein, P2 family [Comamonas kerstersii]AQZ99584.1 phage major capsid protein, P2 family [Comamonas kerstersii]
MRNETRVLFNGYLNQIAALCSIAVADVSKKFNVTPSAQQKLETKLQQSSKFLSMINIVPVEEQVGEAIGLTISGTIAGRTDTSGAGRRSPRDVTGLVKNEYFCKQTDYDTYLPYAKLDAWAKFPDFQTRISGAIVERCALDRIMIGFNGTSAAADTNITNNPLLQDVAKGWLQHIRENAEERVLNGATYGHADADYKSLDGLVFDAIQLLDTVHRDDPDLVVLVGRDLMNDKLFPLVDGQEAPTEKLAADIVVSQRRLGGLPAVMAPYFPAGTVLITRLDNLSIYYQEGKRRRAIIENPARNGVETFESSNDAFVVEDYDLVALVENIQEYEPPVQGG